MRLVGTVPTTLPPSRIFLQYRYSSVGTSAIFLVLALVASATVAATPRSLLVDCISFDCVAVDLSMKLVLSILFSDDMRAAPYYPVTTRISTSLRERRLKADQGTRTEEIVPGMLTDSLVSSIALQA